MSGLTVHTSFLRCHRTSSHEVLFLPRPQIGGRISKGNMSYRACSKHSQKKRKRAAFFDVDGTITKTNVVEAYCSYRVHEIPMALRPLWLPLVAVSCLALLLVDHIDRTTFNHLFYRASFKNRSVHDKKTMSRAIYQDYYRPRLLRGAEEKILQLKKQGYHIVLVTGSLDFLIEPLARELGADSIYSSKLVEMDGIFTGQVRGAGASSSGKAQCMQQYAAARRICMSRSLAFGDSIADLCMLEMVGMPCAVNPDKRLKNIARSRGWPVVYWKLEEGNSVFFKKCISSIISKLSSFSTDNFLELVPFPVHEVQYANIL